MTEAELDHQVEEIKEKLRLPSLKDSVRMMIDYCR